MTGEGMQPQRSIQSRTNASIRKFRELAAVPERFTRCVIEWLNQHPASAPGRCAWCGKAESGGAMVLPFETQPGTHRWLNAECWSVWHQARWASATAALRATVE
jgi:hypothetical protein